MRSEEEKNYLYEFKQDSCTLDWGLAKEKPFLQTAEHGFWVDTIIFNNCNCEAGGILFQLYVDISNEEYVNAKKEAVKNGWTDDFEKYHHYVRANASIENGKMVFCGKNTEVWGIDGYGNENASAFIPSDKYNDALFLNSIDIDKDLPQLEKWGKELLKDLSQTKGISDAFKEKVEEVLLEDVTVSRAKVQMWEAMLRETQKSMQGIPISDGSYDSLPSDYLIKKQMTEEVLGRKIGYDMNGITVNCAGLSISWQNFCKAYEYYGGIEVKSRVDEGRYNLADILVNCGYIYIMEQNNDYDGLHHLFDGELLTDIKSFEVHKDVEDYTVLIDEQNPKYDDIFNYAYYDMRDLFREISTYLYESNITPLAVDGAKFISIDFENPREEDKPIIEECLETEREKKAVDDYEIDDK